MEYTGYISIEMGRQENVQVTKKVIEYVREIFG